MKFWLSVRHTVASVTLPTWKVGECEFTVTTHAAILLLRCGYGGNDGYGGGYGCGYGGDGDCLLRSVHFRSFVQVLKCTGVSFVLGRGCQLFCWGSFKGFSLLLTGLLSVRSVPVRSVPVCIVCIVCSVTHNGAYQFFKSLFARDSR